MLLQMKRHLFILAVAAFGLVNSAAAQTNVSGYINANTNWTLAGSPYIVTGNALLSQGYTLTIDPGVVVKFDANNALQIDGQLIAIGTLSQRIVFTSNQASPQPGDWAKLHFSDFSVDATYDAQGNYVSGTIMKYCDVLYGGSLMWGSIDIQQCSPYFNHCRITDGSWCGINFNGDHLTIDSTRISNFPKRGIYYQGGPFLFRNDSIVSCLEGAIHCLSNYGGVQSRILDSYFRWNFGALSSQNSGLGHLTVKNTKFLNNNGPAVIALEVGGDTISCNTFRNNSNGPVLDWHGWSAAGPVIIHNNIIEYNTNSGPSVFNIEIDYDTAYISHNTIRHNSSPGNAVCEYNIALTCSTANLLQFYNNECTENDGVSFMRFDAPQTNDPTCDFIYMNANNFFNPLCTYELYNAIPYGSPNYFVDGNYWGSPSTSYIDGKIYDYFDFANQSVVYYNPILTQPVAVDTACYPFHLPLGISENGMNDQQLRIFPNPTDGSITITINDEALASDLVIEILNPLSQVIYHESIPYSATTTIGLPAESGVYIVRLITKEGISVAKVVKE